MKGHVGDGACVLGASGSVTQFKASRCLICPSYPLRLTSAGIGSRSSYLAVGGTFGLVLLVM